MTNAVRCRRSVRIRIGRTYRFRRQRGSQGSRSSASCAPRRSEIEQPRIAGTFARRSYQLALMVAVGAGLYAGITYLLLSDLRLPAVVRQCCNNDGSASVMGDRERERFVKLLGLTRSSNDGEALAALRKCNDVLTQHRLSWADVVAGRCARQGHRDTDLLDEIGRVVNARRRNDRVSPSRTFADSIRREAISNRPRRQQRMMAARLGIRKIPLLLRLFSSRSGRRPKFWPALWPRTPARPCER